jgi:hypothetical protein
MKYIRIVSGNVQIVEETIQSEAPLASTLQELQVKASILTDRLPRGIAFLSYDPTVNTGVFVIERPPTLQVLHGLSSLSVSLPWSYFVFKVFLENGLVRGNEDTYLFWSKERVGTIDSYLYAAALPNVDESGGICWGDVQTYDDRSVDKIDQRINEFYVNEFNDDLWSLPSDFGSVEEWAEASIDEYSFMDWNHWHNTSPVQRVRDLLGRTADTVLPSIATLPPPPSHFSRARARAWALSGDTPAAQRRVLLQGIADALRELPEPEATPEEPEAVLEEAPA